MKADYIDLFLEALTKTTDKAQALQPFCRQYHYFSVNQILAFSKMSLRYHQLDLASVCEIAKTIYEEYGSGQPERIHSVLFEKMARACGVQPTELPLPSGQVFPGIKGYLEELNAAFARGSLPQALSAYVFLEKTAVTMYPRFLSALETMGFDAEALDFFTVHAHLEPKHLEAAHALVKHQGFSAAQMIEFEEQFAKLETKYHAFWEDLRQSLLSVGADACLVMENVR